MSLSYFLPWGLSVFPFRLKYDLVLVLSTINSVSYLLCISASAPALLLKVSTNPRQISESTMFQAREIPVATGPTTL